MYYVSRMDHGIRIELKRSVSVVIDEIEQLQVLHIINFFGIDRNQLSYHSV